MNGLDPAAISSLTSANQLSSNRLALDANALESLKRDAKADSPETRRQAAMAAAKQFEAVFMNMLMKSMRDATPQDNPFSSDASRSYQGMLDEQMVQSMSSSKGMGLANIIARQLLGEGGNNLPDGMRGLNNLDSSGQLQDKTPIAPSSSAIKAYQSNSSSAADPKADAFIQQHWAAAKAAEQTTGVPAQFILGQAALESGWGKKEIKAADGSTSFNLFGIKADKGWKGGIATSMTTEYVQGEKTKSRENFRAYGSYAEAFTDYANLLKNNPRYQKALNSGGSAEQFASNLQKAGYATDPNYASKLTNTINRTLRVAV